ncbi:MAG: LapA family protein [Gammaproteobacteria bacterium]|jgi:putative membrane protein
MSRAKWTLSLILVAVVLLFALQNTQVVEVRLLFWKLSMSRVLLIFLLLAVGAILGWVANSAYRRRMHR